METNENSAAARPDPAVTISAAYRPDHWYAAEIVTAGSGLAAALFSFVSTRVDPLDLNPSVYPLTWPQLPPLALLAVLLGLVPLVAAPPPVTEEAAP